MDELTVALQGRYAIERELGAGGMATVYLARDLQHDRLVALKAILRESASPVQADRFRREIRLVAQLHHPHIVPVFDSGEAGGRLWYTMPYVEGESLRARLQRQRELPLADIARIATQVASALDEAHRRGILHRDVKPENILLTAAGDALLADFGIARPAERGSGGTLTADGSAVGTPAYMSPEQITGDRVLDGRSDQYALASVVYEAVVGEPPHVGASIQHIIMKRLAEPPRPVRSMRPSVPPSWDAALQRALAIAPADRFDTAGSFAAVLAADTGVAGTISRAAPLAFFRRHRVAASTASAVVLVGIAAGWIAWRRPRTAEVNLERSVKLTYSGRVRAPALSPDEKQLAYVTSTCIGNHCSYAVEIQRVGGVETRRVLEGATAAYLLAWSPDRQSLMFFGTLNGRSGSYLVSTLTGAPRFLTSGYATFYGGGDSLLLTPAPVADSVFWVRVATLDGAVRDSFRVAGPGNGLGLVTAVPRSPWFVAAMFTPDGMSYLLVDHRGRERSRAAAGGILSRVSEDALWVQSGYRGNPGTRIVRIPLDARAGRFSGRRTVVFTGALTGFDVTADGGRLVVDRGSPEYNTWVTDLGAAAREGALQPGPPLISRSSPSLIRLSPDGSRLLMDRAVGTASGETEQLLVMPAGGGEGSPIALRGGLLDAHWVDSVTIAIGEDVRDTVRLSLLDVRTGARRGELQPRDSTIGDFDWLPSGGWVWISDNGQSLRVRLDADSSARTIPKPAWYSSLAGVLAAPDGRRIAYIGWNKTTWDTLRLATVAVGGGEETPWFAALAEHAAATWLEDGSLMYQVLEGAEVLTLYHVRAPARVERLASVPWHAWDAQVSRDLRRAAITTQDYRADAWLSQVVRR